MDHLPLQCVFNLEAISNNLCWIVVSSSVSLVYLITKNSWWIIVLSSAFLIKQISNNVWWIIVLFSVSTVELIRNNHWWIITLPSDIYFSMFNCSIDFFSDWPAQCHLNRSSKITQAQHVHKGIGSRVDKHERYRNFIENSKPFLCHTVFTICCCNCHNCIR